MNTCRLDAAPGTSGKGKRKLVLPPMPLLSSKAKAKAMKTEEQGAGCQAPEPSNQKDPVPKHSQDTTAKVKPELKDRSSKVGRLC